MRRPTEPAADAGLPFESSDDHLYFQTIEDAFIALRGAPLTLSPADWQLARRWHRAGIPAALVVRAVTETFAKRRARGAKTPVRSLRFCASAVEAAWRDEAERLASGARDDAPIALDLTPRWHQLHRALDGVDPRLDAAPLRRALDQLASGPAAAAGDLDALEHALQDLDAQLRAAASEALDDAERAAMANTIDRSLRDMGRSPHAPDAADVRDALARQLLRERFALPVLSLYALPDAD
ncbi:MAG: hypothetical protein AAF772_12430 [Acidobacteriota bacterium]